MTRVAYLIRFGLLFRMRSMKSGHYTIQLETDPRTPSFDRPRAQRKEKRFDIPPCQRSGDRRLKDPAQGLAMSPVQRRDDIIY
jgi:hypothetical protein